MNQQHAKQDSTLIQKENISKFNKSYTDSWCWVVISARYTAMFIWL